MFGLLFVYDFWRLTLWARYGGGCEAVVDAVRRGLAVDDGCDRA